MNLNFASLLLFSRSLLSSFCDGFHHQMPKSLVSRFHPLITFSPVSEIDHRKITLLFNAEDEGGEEDEIEPGQPGGMDPETLKTLIGNPDVMALLQNTKMQEAMQTMMTEGQEGLEKKMATDPELQEIVKKLNSLMSFM